MPSGVGVCTLPIVVINGTDPASGSYTIPMFVVSGGAGISAAGDVFYVPVPIVSGTSGLTPSQYTLISLTVPTISSVGYTGVLGKSGTLNLPVLVVSGGYSYRGDGTFTLPALEVHTIPPLHAVGTFSIPVPLFSGLYGGIGTLIPISKIYRGIVMNINNQAISTYSGFNFNSLAYFNEKYYGVNETGIHLLGGGHDNITRNIISKLRTGAMNFGDNFIKYLREVWLTYRTDGHLELTVFADEDSDTISTSQTEIVSNKIEEENLQVARGLRGRFYTIELKNISGADFDVEGLSMLIDAIKKKAR